MGNIVAIVGRPNVGKSTLFNRLVEQRKAIVDDFSGVTRDRHYGKSEWIGKEFTVIDTGGYVPDSEDIFESAIRSQVKIAISEADVLLFMVDVSAGITELDKDFADILRRTKKPVYVVVNKVDIRVIIMVWHTFVSCSISCWKSLSKWELRAANSTSFLSFSSLLACIRESSCVSSSNLSRWILA
jgi:GTP-binding protein